jgi:hypothetical protein
MTKKRLARGSYVLNAVIGRFLMKLTDNYIKRQGDVEPYLPWINPFLLILCPL